MARTTPILHLLANGTLARRDSTRTYTHVIVADLADVCSIANKNVGPGPSVVGYTNTGSIPAHMPRMYGPCHLEAVNNGERV